MVDEIQRRNDLGHGWTTGLKFRNPSPEEQALGVWGVVQTPAKGLEELLLIEEEVEESRAERPVISASPGDNVGSILNQIQQKIVSGADETLMVD